MALVKVSPTHSIDEAIARKYGIPLYVAPASAKTARPVGERSKPAPARPAPSMPVVHRSTKPQPRDIPEAMRAGWSNSEILSAVRRGDLESCDTMKTAELRWWPPHVIREAKGRGLIW